MGAFSKQVSCRWVVETELESIYYALLILKNNRVIKPSKLAIKSDSLEVVELIYNRRQVLWYLEDVVKRIKTLMDTFEDVKIYHIDRCENWEADDLAKKGLSRCNAWILWE